MKHVKVYSLEIQHIYTVHVYYIDSSVVVSVTPINTSVDYMTENVTLTCHSDALDLNVSYTWMFNGTYINTSNDDAFTVNGPQLILHNVTHTLGGMYECNVTNLIGSGRGHGYLFGM